MTAQQERKQHIRAFMQAHYTDERLAQLLAHAQDGKLAFHSCCCFIGVATADHALRGYRFKDFRERADGLLGIDERHYILAESLPGAQEAEHAFDGLSDWHGSEYDAARRRILIPMIRAEQRRRERARTAQSTPELAEVCA